MNKKISTSAYLFFTSAFTFFAAILFSGLAVKDIKIFLYPVFILDITYGTLIRAAFGGLILYFIKRINNERANIKFVKKFFYVAFFIFVICIYVAVFLLFIEFMKSLFYLPGSIDYFIMSKLDNFNFVPMNDFFSSIWNLPQTIEYFSTSENPTYLPYHVFNFLSNAFFFAASIIFIYSTGKIYKELQEKVSLQPAESKITGENEASSVKMTFGKSISQCFYKNFYFEGTASRSEYWWFFLFTNGIKLLLVLATFFCAVSFHEFLLMILFALFAIFHVITFLPEVSVSVRRAHDAGLMGLFAFLPLFNFVTMLFPTDENSIYKDGRCRHPKLKALARIVLVISLVLFIVYFIAIEKNLYFGNYLFRFF